MALAARQRGWPAPVIYADGDPAPADGYSPALERLTAAIVSGRHNAVLMTAPGTLGDPGPLITASITLHPARCHRQFHPSSGPAKPGHDGTGRSQPLALWLLWRPCQHGDASTQTKVTW